MLDNTSLKVAVGHAIEAADTSIKTIAVFRVILKPKPPKSRRYHAVTYGIVYKLGNLRGSYTLAGSFGTTGREDELDCRQSGNELDTILRRLVCSHGDTTRDLEATSEYQDKRDRLSLLDISTCSACLMPRTLHDESQCWHETCHGDSSDAIQSS